MAPPLLHFFRMAHRLAHSWHAVFWRGVPTGKNGNPSAPVAGTAVLTSPLLSRFTPREPA